MADIRSKRRRIVAVHLTEQDDELLDTHAIASNTAVSNGNGDTITHNVSRKPVKPIDMKPTTRNDVGVPSKESHIATGPDESKAFLDTVNRTSLDFDGDEVCSVTLSNHSVYCCLVCGKLLQGRGRETPAYTHSVDMDHHVYLNLTTCRFYVLPDGYEVHEESLQDICLALRPKFNRDSALQLDVRNDICRALSHRTYLPGFVGLNELGKTDYINVVVQALAHLGPFRNFFLLEEQDLCKTAIALQTRNLLKIREQRSVLVFRWAELVRKIWNNHAFKTHVSPHRFVQAVYSSSNHTFRLDKQSNPHVFLMWFLNQLHTGLMRSPAKSTGSLVHECFRGKLRVETKPYNGDPKTLLTTSTNSMDVESKEKLNRFSDKEIPFLMLSLDLPLAPLFDTAVMEEGVDIVNRNGKNIPQISLLALIARRYDGKSLHVVENGKALSRYKIIQLPRFLIFHIKRFTSNNYVQEKSKTIVTFPLKDLDMRDFLYMPDGNVPSADSLTETRYNLIANITHEGPTPEGGVYKVHVEDKSRGQWYQMQDLFVEKVASQMIFLADSYIQIWERKDVINSYFS